MANQEHVNCKRRVAWKSSSLRTSSSFATLFERDVAA
ncbi:hypothetical protein FOCG_10835 [Fusarium oxysporum f. sp. radicis-lycopersici 26381]|uniref:Uncharacterized protein n=1 Tax=Fusarium oxysporum Fo47 TaxID=660027 RepID=W9JW44_FUSOX|nr:hypothetical protein FOZG_12608 [Fusarium oxysporum Fo47]EWZ95190.1 hypothetical protein FOWG_05177 [Fusarium oxysporum f. sp. lycopersici MN25]EXL48430.1 hypothetical protein FOCG_10835 [Fusarium oxysporum f. sp. radicis-lycopersici 26381]